MEYQEKKFSFSTKAVVMMVLAVILLVMGIVLLNSVPAEQSRYEQKMADYQKAVERITAEEQAALETALEGPVSLNDIAWDQVEEAGCYRVVYDTIYGPYASMTTTHTIIMGGVAMNDLSKRDITTYYYAMSYTDGTGEQVWVSAEFYVDEVEEVAAMGEELFFEASLNPDKVSRTSITYLIASDVGELFLQTQPDGKEIYLEKAYDSREEYLEDQQRDHEQKLSSRLSREVTEPTQDNVRNTKLISLISILAAPVMVAVAFFLMHKEAQKENAEALEE